MQKPNFWQLLLKKGVSVQGILLGVISCAIGLFFDPKFTISGKWFVFWLATEFFFTFLFGTMLLEVWMLLDPRSPRVRNVSRPVLQGQQRLLLLLDPCEAFAHEAVVSLYRKNQEFEIFMGIGHVLTVQSNGFIQVLVERMEASLDPQFLTELEAGNATRISEIIVKTTVPRALLVNALPLP